VDTAEGNKVVHGSQYTGEIGATDPSASAASSSVAISSTSNSADSVDEATQNAYITAPVLLVFLALIIGSWLKY
jgi:hypothetical protein